MDDPEALFRAKYDSLRIAFESRLASLANTVRLSIQHMSTNEVLRELNSTSITRKFAPDHARLLIKRHLAAERDKYFYHLTLKLADAEGEASLYQRRNEDLASSLAAMRADVTLRERSDAKFTNVKTDIQELRRDYQKALEEASAECHQIKAQLGDSQRRLTSVIEERDEQAAHIRSQQAELTAAWAREVQADLRGTSLPRVERELGEQKSTNARLSSKLSQSQERVHDLTTSNQRLELQVRSLRNDATQHEKYLQQAIASSKKSEAQFRDTIARVESLMEEKAKESAGTIGELRDKALNAKDRLSEQVKRLASTNAQLNRAMAKTKVEISELQHRTEAAQTSKEAGAEAAAAREKVLMAEVEQARARADAMSQSLAEAIREQSGLVAETVNAKAAVEVLEARNRSAELERARTAAYEAERGRTSTAQCALSGVSAPVCGGELIQSVGAGMQKILADKLEDASNHISQLRSMLRQTSEKVKGSLNRLLMVEPSQEIGRRETAEAEVSEAQGHLDSSRRELKELRHLAGKLEKIGRTSIVHVDKKNQAIKHLQVQLQVRGLDPRVDMGGGEKHKKHDGEAFELKRKKSRHQDRRERLRYVRRSCSASDESSESVGDKRDERTDRSRGLRHPICEESNREMMMALSILRADLRGMARKVIKAKADNDEIVRRFTSGVASRANYLTQTLQRAVEERAVSRRQASEALAAGAKDRKAVARLESVVQAVSSILYEGLGVRVPSTLWGGGASFEDPEVLQRALSELSSSVANAVFGIMEDAEENLHKQIHMESLELKNGDGDRDGDRERSTHALDGAVRGERSKDDFKIVAELQKIEVENELQSLRAQVDEISVKYSAAVAERASVDNARLEEARKWAQDEAAQIERDHRSAVAALETALEVERNHCKDLRTRLDRQMHEHQNVLTNSEEKLLQTQQDLDKAVSSILYEALGVRLPSILWGGGAPCEDPGVLQRALSELSSSVANAVTRIMEDAKENLRKQIHIDSLKSKDGDSDRESSTRALDGAVWGEKSKDDFNMVAELQKIEVENELQSLRAQVDDMSVKYSAAVAERASADNTRLEEARKWAQDEAAQVERDHRRAVAALETALEVERSHCKDLRTRLDRQMREHQTVLTDSEQKLLQTQQDLDKVQHDLEQTKFASSRESARRARLEKKLRELGEHNSLSPRSLSPIYLPRSVPSQALGGLSEEQDATRSAQTQSPLYRCSSVTKNVLEEARVKLGRECSDDRNREGREKSVLDTAADTKADTGEALRGERL